MKWAKCLERLECINSPHGVILLVVISVISRKIRSRNACILGILRILKYFCAFRANWAICVFGWLGMFTCLCVFGVFNAVTRVTPVTAVLVVLRSIGSIHFL